jgi:hypothetical protein
LVSSGSLELVSGQNGSEMEHRTHVATVLGLALTRWLCDGDAAELAGRLREILEVLEEGSK